MNSESGTRAVSSRLGRFAQSRVLAFAGFLSAQLGLVWLGLHGFSTPMGDIIYAYEPWAQQMLQSGKFFGLQLPWVYPWPNLLLVFGPTSIFPTQFGSDYQGAWLVESAAFSFVAVLVLLLARGIDSRRKALAVWFWTAALILLGPVSVSRLDSFSIALGVVGVVAWVRLKPRAAAIWFTLGVWFKVWPIALLIGLWASVQKRWHLIAVLSGVGLAVLFVGYLLGGSPHNLLSFVTDQSNRGIQIESPWAAFWLWAGVFGSKDAGLYFDMPLQTFQVFGPGNQIFANLLGPVMYLALGITAFLGWKAAQIQLLGSLEASNRVVAFNRVFAWTSLTGVLDLIVFNKVGSPQYYGWLIVPVMFGLLVRVWPSRTVVVWFLAISALTGLIYPYIYDSILASAWWAIAILTVRNLLVVGLLVYCNLKLTELGKVTRV
jgi:hypothetical protein